MPITRRKFIEKATLGSAAAAIASKLTAQTAPMVTPKGLAKPPMRPNLLFLWTDQHRGDTVPWADNNVVKASNFFEPLAQRSFLFHRTYITQPVCTPSRGSIMTGICPHNHGAWQNNIPLGTDALTIAEQLPSEYAKAYYGKWHLGNENNAQRGFSDWRSIEDIYRKYYKEPADLARFSDHYNFLLERGFPPDNVSEDAPDSGAVFSRSMAAALPEQYTKVAFLADEAEKFLHARKDGQPFILHVNSLEPHPPTYGPLNEFHDPADMPAGPAFARPLPEGASALARAMSDRIQKDGYKNHPIATEHDWRRLRCNYYGLVSMVDRAYARIMRALEASGQADNTIVVYTSDHGDMCGDHCLMQKSNFYEGSTRVPLAIHVPWLSRGRVDFHSPISTIDLVPTLLDLMGADRASNIDGVSRASVLRNPGTWTEENVTVEWNDAENPAFHGRSRVTADRWKLNLYAGDRPELFDLNTDPGEITNRAAEPAQLDRVRILTEEIQTWQQRTKDSLALATS